MGREDGKKAQGILDTRDQQVIPSKEVPSNKGEKVGKFKMKGGSLRGKRWGGAKQKKNDGQCERGVEKLVAGGGERHIRVHKFLMG